MHLDDLPAKAEANARTLIFCGKKRHEDLFLKVSGNTRAIIAEMKDYDAVGFFSDPDTDRRQVRVRHGLHGIFHQIDQHLFQEVRVSLNG